MKRILNILMIACGITKYFGVNNELIGKYVFVWSWGLTIIAILSALLVVSCSLMVSQLRKNDEKQDELDGIREKFKNTLDNLRGKLRNTNLLTLKGFISYIVLALCMVTMIMFGYDLHAILFFIALLSEFFATTHMIKVASYDGCEQHD